MINADYLFKNGQVLTVNSADEIKTSVAVCGNRIVYVGDDEGSNEYIGPTTHIINLNGRSLVPGFIDSHMHIGSLGINMRHVDCSPKCVKSIQDIQTKLSEAARSLPKGSLIRAFNYNPYYLIEKRHPTRWELDAAAPEHMVLLTHGSYHLSVSNSLALKYAGIDDDTPDPAGGEYGRENGVLNGFAAENAHWNMFKTFPYTEEEMETALLTADKVLSEKGITSIHDAGDGTAMIKCLTSLNKRKLMNTRIYSMLYSIYGNSNADFVTKYFGIGFHTGFGNEGYKIGPLKLMLDGSSVGGTSALRKTYSNKDGYFGILTMDQAEVNRLVLQAHLDDYQVTCHAIGDKAIEMMLDAYENAFSVKPRSDCRHRLEHCALVDPGLIDRIKKMGIIPIPQPAFIDCFGDSYLEFYGERTDYMFPCKSFLDEGIIVAFGSDVPVIAPDPILNIYTACNRVSRGGMEMGRAQEISVLEALRMHTYNGAYASFEENIKGSIEVGKLADLVLLSKPLVGTEIGSIREIEVEMTMIDGRIVFTSSRMEG